MPAPPDHAGDVAERAIRRVVGTRGTGLLRPAETGTGAEVTLTGAREHDRAHAECRRELLERVAEVVAHRRGERVPRLGAVDRHPRDAAVDGDLHLLVDGRLVSHAGYGRRPDTHVRNLDLATGAHP